MEHWLVCEECNLNLRFEDPTCRDDWAQTHRVVKLHAVETYTAVNGNRCDE